MRFGLYIKEDYETVREYKKAIFDLNVALGEKEFMEEEKPEKDPERARRQKEGMINIKKKIITLKEKIQKLSMKLGESIDPKLQKILDKIPDLKDVDPNYKGDGEK
jgi:predicted RNase H-like nuclease (RuvC/YqgF family)